MNDTRSRLTILNRGLRLFEHLRTVPRKGFDMKAWAVSDNTVAEGVQIGTACGTVACIAGHAATVFRDLCLLSVGTGADDATLFDVIHRKTEGLGADALSDALGLDWWCDERNQIERLCVDMAIRTPKQAAAALLKILKVWAKKWNLEITEVPA